MSRAPGIYKLASITALILLVIIAAPVVAQRDCGDGLPCGKLLWDLPLLPTLQTPTPMPTFDVSGNVQPTDVSGAVPTPAPAATNTPVPTNVDASSITDNLSTLSAVMSETPMMVTDLNGTPFDQDAAFEELGTNAGTFFGFARSIISPVTFGPLWPLVALVVTSLTVVFGVKIITYGLPVFAALFGFIRKMVQIILDFIPL